ncbi:MAG: hypothetical protein DLM64_13820, partial [Solirubrobacterales bacterium]
HGGAGFLFIPDITNNATGAVLIALLVLYVGTQLGSSLLMSSPTMDKTQRRIMLVMPLFFVFIFIRYPAGLLVYWITTNLWTIMQQYIVKRRIGPITPPATALAGAGAGAGASSGGSSGMGSSGGAKKAAPSATGGGSSGSKKSGRSGAGGGSGGTKRAVPSAGGPDGSKKQSGGQPSAPRSRVLRGEPNGAGTAGGIARLLRDKVKPPDQPAPASSQGANRTVAPPPPPRKKKKRSGRRR